MTKNVEDLLELKELPFDPSEWLNKTSELKVGKIEKVAPITEHAKKKKFIELCKIVEEEFKEEINKDEESSNEWIERQYQAIIGNTSAGQYFINKIEAVLRDKNITSNDYPDFFDSLAEAIFHEAWGVSILAKWDKKYPNSEAAVIRGLELWIDIDGKFIRQKEEFDSLHKVNKVKENFKIRQETAVLNKQNPSLEIEREDGSRITMIIPPRSKEDYLVIRRFIIKDFTLEKQAELDTIPYEDIPFYRALARTHPNTLFCGRVRSAKSTFMKTLLKERDPDLVIACIEKHFELSLQRHMPERLIYEFQVEEGNLHIAMPRLLRMEHDMLIVGECRSIEWEAAMEACERGERGFMTTYHLTDVRNIVPQVARHLLDEYPNRTVHFEVERVARNIDVVVIMGTDRGRKVKKVLSVSEVIWNEETGKYDVRDWIKYSYRSKKYYYSSDISPRLYHLLAEENEDEARTLLETLKQREQVSSMANYSQKIRAAGGDL